MDINKIQIGSRIKQIRLNNGDTLKDFGIRIARVLNIPTSKAPSKSNVSKWEKGSSLPNKERLKVIAELGGMSVEELLHGSKEEIAKKAVDDAADEFVMTSSEYGLYFQENYERYNAIIKDLREKYKNVESIIAFEYDNPYDIIKQDVYDYFESELFLGARTRQNMLNQYINILEDAITEMEIYSNNKFTQEAVEKGEISEEEMKELQNKVWDVHQEFMKIEKENSENNKSKKDK